MNHFDLKLTLNNDVLTLNGKEENLRKLSSYMIRNTEYKGFSYADSNFFLNDKYETDHIKSKIEEIFKQCHFIYNDYSINNILLHLIITIDRLKKRFYVEKRDQDLRIDEMSFNAAGKVADYLASEYGIYFTSSEVENMAMFLSCNLATIDCRYIEADYLNNIVNKRSIDIARKIAAQISDFYLLEGFDEVFMARFILHVDNLIKRQENNFSARNPLSENIFEAYPLIYDIAVFAANVFKKETGYKINQDEISLLALHIGSFIESNNSNKDKLTALYVYADYHDFYQNNIVNIQNRFPSSIMIKYSTSVFAMEQGMEYPDVDLIISEIRIPDSIYVSSFVTDSQYEDIARAIARKAKQKSADNFTVSLKSLFDEKMFFHNLNHDDEYEVINDLIERLKPLNIFNEDFEASVIERERTAPTAFTNHLAIPHAISQHVNHSFISITTFDKVQKWADKNVSVVIMIGIAYPERKIFRSVFNNLIRLFDDDVNIKKISSCSTYEELINCLSDITK